MGELFNSIPWYGKLILGLGVILLFAVTYQQGKINGLNECTK